MSNYTSNILDTFGRATSSDMESGLGWYQDANDIAREISPSNVSAGAGVIAALSPMMSWNRNMSLARLAFENGFAKGGLYTNCNKADAILSGADPMSVLGGDKVRSFYQNILDPSGMDIVTIDRHAYDIGMGHVTGKDSKNRLSLKGIYAEFAESYREAARELNLIPSQVQAVTWVTWRRTKAMAA